jgi:CRISPR/Cas system CMR-associated protein Cmr5 small subunit
MKSQGIILHGTDLEKNLGAAYSMASEYMELDEYHNKHLLSNTHPNSLFIKKLDDENEVSVSRSRSIIEFLSQRPSIPGKLSVIIKGFENFSRNAANAILKILEEPPANSIIILTTRTLQSVIPTIRSRCVKIRINSDRCKGIDHDDPKVYLISRLRNIDPDMITKTVNFLESKTKNIIDFAEQHSEEYEEFFKIVLFYCEFILHKKENIQSADNLLKLHELYSLSKNTYPDKQGVIISALSLIT